MKIDADLLLKFLNAMQEQDKKVLRGSSSRMDVMATYENIKRVIESMTEEDHE